MLLGVRCAGGSLSWAFAKHRVGGLSLRRRQCRIERLERRQKPLQVSELDLVVLDFGTQVVD